MKKIFVLILALVALQVSAQDIKIIPKVGFNLANMTKLGKGDVRPGVNAGVGFDFKVDETFSIEPGIYYSMQGSKNPSDLEGLVDKYASELIGSSVTGVSKLTVKNDYINIPIYGKAYLADGFYVFAGPQFGFLVSSKLNMKALGLLEYSPSIKDYMNTFDLSVGIGVGYQMPEGLQISANYNIGATNVVNTSKLGGVSYDGLKAHNNVFQINIGYAF